MKKRLLALIFFSTIWPLLGASADLKKPPILSVPLLKTEPLITAAINDPAWRKAVCTPPFSFAVDRLDDARIPAGAQLLSTRVLLGWSPKALYVRFVCEDDAIYSPMKGPEQNYYLADSVETFLDPIGDQRQWIEVIVSPDDGVLHILHLYTSPTAACDKNGVVTAPNDLWNITGWPALLDVKTAAGRWKDKNGKSGWLIDMAFPPTILQRLRLNHFESMTLRANFVRNDYQFTTNSPTVRKLVPSNWSPTLNSLPHMSPGRMGFLRLASKTPP